MGGRPDPRPAAGRCRYGIARCGYGLPNCTGSTGAEARSYMIRVLVVDDHPLVRETLTELLNSAGDLAVVGQCADGGEVAAAVIETRPDVALLDVQMPRVDGLTAAREVRATQPGL